MIQSLAALACLVPGYDERIAFFHDALGFVALEDVHLGPNERRILAAPEGGAPATIVLAVPSDEQERARIGDENGGWVGYFLLTFLLTDDFLRDYGALRSEVSFAEAPRCESRGQPAVFVDPWSDKRNLSHATGGNGDVR